MNFVWILAAIMVIAAIWKYFNEKGSTKLYVEIYEVIGTSVARVNPKGPTACKIKKIDGVDKLILPAKYTQGKELHLEPPKHDHYVSNPNGLKLLQLLKIADGDFKILQPDIDINAADFPRNQYTIIDRDVAFWADNEKKRVEIDHKIESRWDKIKPYLALGMVVFGAVIIMWMAMDKAESIMTDVKEINEDTQNWLQKLTADPTNIANKVSIGEKEQVPTDASAPPGNG